MQHELNMILSIEFYLEACEKLGQKPQKAHSGKLTLRVSPEIHWAVATAAEINQQSINQWATTILNQAAKRELA